MPSIDRSDYVQWVSIDYSDGAAIEAQILGLLREAGSLDSEQPMAPPGSPWAIRYHLSPDRANLLRHLDFGGLRVLEIGAGMGAISRLLAERSAHLRIIEGTEARYRAAKERMRDLENWDGQIANIQDVVPDQHFDVVCVIGVMEYSELYVASEGGKTPFDRFLELAKSHLAPDGVVVLAIENQLGLKYWSGAAEDHTGKLSDGISGYGLNPTPRTFSRKGLIELFHRNGFPAVEEYFPFPDYKMPATVLTSDLVDDYPQLAADLATTREFESYGERRVRFFPDVLAAHSVSQAGLLKEFSNSFLVVAAPDKESETFKKVNSAKRHGELAWHYSMGRAHPVTTTFDRSGSGGDLRASKSSWCGTAHVAESDANWHSVEEIVLLGETLRTRLIRSAYFDGTADALKSFTTFMRATVREFGSEGDDGSEVLAANSIDAIYRNAIVDGDDYKWFDLEWTHSGPVEISWLILRNLLVLKGDQEFWIHDGKAFSLKKIYNQVCISLGVEPHLVDDITKEARFRAMALHGQSAAVHESDIQLSIDRPFMGITYPKRSRDEFYLQGLYGIVRRPSLSLAVQAPRFIRATLRRRG